MAHNKIKVLEIIGFYSLEEISEYIDKGNKFPKHHLWGYDKLIEAGFTVDEMLYNKNSFLNKIGRFIHITNLEQQIKIIKNNKNYDIIYAENAAEILIVALLRLSGIIKTPLLGILHTTTNYSHKNIIKRNLLKLHRTILLNGMDKILYINKQTYFADLKYGKIPQKHSFLRSWGVDVSFFDEFIQNQHEKPTNQYFFSTGGSNRDFHLLHDAFANVECKLVISTKYEKDFFNSSSSNIVVDNSIPFGFDSAAKLLPYYYNAKAFCIALKDKVEMCTGLTVIFESMAMGKPIITTKNEFYSLDVEESGVGLNVDFNDKAGWINAINYMIENPDIAASMGIKGKALCKEQYNYDLFCAELIQNIENVIINNQAN